jgi:hypothetical protein
MKNKQLPENPGFKLRDIEILDLSIIHPNKPIEPVVTYNFDVKIELKILTEKDLYLSICTVDVSNKETGDKCGNIKVCTYFEVQNLKEFIDEKTKKTNLPKELETTLNSICLSTTRGIMFSEFRGTFLHNALLPLVDTNMISKKITGKE